MQTSVPEGDGRSRSDEKSDAKLQPSAFIVPSWKDLSTGCAESDLSSVDNFDSLVTTESAWNPMFGFGN